MNTPEQRRNAHSASPKTMGFHIALLAVTCLSVYGNTFKNGFFLDDFHYILENSHIRTICPFWRHFIDPSTTSSLVAHLHYRPLLPATLSVTHHFFGFEPLGYHLFNIAFHLIATFAVYSLILELLGFERPKNSASARELPARDAALFGALLFSGHPVSGFAVNYLSGRDNLMMLAFFLLFLVLYIRMRRARAAILGWGATLVCLALSLLSKPNSIVAPVVVLAFELLIARARWRSPALLARVGAVGAVVLAFLLVRQHLLAKLELPLWGTRGDSGFDTRMAYLMTQLKYHLSHYLANFVWPFRIRALPGIQKNTELADPLMWIGAIFVLGSLVAAWLSRKNHPLISFGILGYWILFSVTSSVLLTHQTVADRWMYPSMPFISLVVSYLVFGFAPRKSRLVLSALVVAYFGVSCHIMNRNYRDDLSLWSQSAKYGTTCMGYMNLGRAYIGKDEEKVKYYYEKSIEANPHAFLTEINLGLWYINREQEEKGLRLVYSGVRDAPSGTEGMSRYWLAVALKSTGQIRKAAEAAEEAARFNPNNVQYLYEAAYLLQHIKRYEEAIKYLDRIERLHPGYRNIPFLKGWCLQELGRTDEAIQQYERSVEQDPGHAKSYFNLGYAYLTKNRCDRAILYFKQFLELSPGDEAALMHIERCKTSRSQ